MKTITLKSGKEIQLNQAFNMDCLDFMKMLPDKCIDLTVTSPPYDNLRTYNDSLEWNDDIWKAIIKELYRVTIPCGVVVWVVGDATINGSETGTSFKQALYFKECGFNLHDTMIYQKTGFANPSSNRYHQTFEYMFILSKGKPKKFNPIKDRKNKYEKRGGGTRRLKNGEMQKVAGYQKLNKYGQRFNIWKIPHQNNIDRIHPASFPRSLAQDHIKSWSNENDIVMDIFGGSFTTAIEAEKNNRKWIITEKDPDYSKSGYHRYEQETKQLLMEF